MAISELKAEPLPQDRADSFFGIEDTATVTCTEKEIGNNWIKLIL
jgi:hypothetical protein